MLPLDRLIPAPQLVAVVLVEQDLDFAVGAEEALEERVVEQWRDPAALGDHGAGVDVHDRRPHLAHQRREGQADLALALGHHLALGQGGGGNQGGGSQEGESEVCFWDPRRKRT